MTKDNGTGKVKYGVKGATNDNVTRKEKNV